MRKKYCLDTSGFSNPLEFMPQDIHPSLWKQVEATVTSGILAVTREIYDELEHLPGSIGDCIRAHRDLILLELGDSSWPWADYRVHARRMQVTRRAVISEYNRNRKNTVGLNDVSIVALAKALHLPVISMEKRSVPPSDTKCRIPDLCSLEGVEHLSFNDFLRKEGIRS
jgi:hypothetical protein